MSSKLWYVGMYFDPQPNAMGQVQLGSAKVVAWNPSTGDRRQRRDRQGRLHQLRPDRQRQRVYLGVGVFAGAADATKLAQGLYVGSADGTLATAGAPIDLGDTPSAIAFQSP